MLVSIKRGQAHIIVQLYDGLIKLEVRHGNTLDNEKERLPAHGEQAFRAYRSDARRKRKALVTTNTLDKAMAPAANTGESKGPPKGYRAPAATGIRATL